MIPEGLFIIGEKWGPKRRMGRGVAVGAARGRRGVDGGDRA